MQPEVREVLCFARGRLVMRVLHVSIVGCGQACSRSVRVWRLQERVLQPEVDEAQTRHGREERTRTRTQTQRQARRGYGRSHETDTDIGADSRHSISRGTGGCHWGVRTRKVIGAHHSGLRTCIVPAHRKGEFSRPPSSADSDHMSFPPSSSSVLRCGLDVNFTTLTPCGLVSTWIRQDCASP
jgi:hypothetical protein